MERPNRALAVLCASALLLGGCAAQADSPSSSDASDEPLNFTIVYGITGAFATFAADFVNGAKIAADAINEAGGVDGRPIEINVLDDKSDPTQAVSVVTDLIDSGDLPDAIMPGGTSSETLALLPLTTDAGLFSVSSAVSPQANDPAAYPYHFGTSAPTGEQYKVIVQAMEDEGVTTVGVMLSGDASGDAMLAGFESALDGSGIEVVQVERPDAQALNFNVEMERIKAASPDAIFFDFSPYDAAARALEARVTVGATGIPIYGGAAASGVPFKTLVADDAMEGCYLPVFRMAVQSDDMPAHLAPLYEAYADSDTSVYIAAFGWDVVNLAAVAFADASEGTAQGYADALVAQPVPADVMALYLSGTSYTTENHFATVDPADMTMVPCGAPQENGGLWVLDR